MKTLIKMEILFFIFAFRIYFCFLFLFFCLVDIQEMKCHIEKKLLKQMKNLKHQLQKLSRLKIIMIECHPHFILKKSVVFPLGLIISVYIEEKRC